MIKKILVPLDGTEVAESALEYAQIIAVRCGAGLALVRVVHASSGTAESALQEAEAYLARLADDLTHMGMNVETGVDYDGPAADWILQEVDTREADLVVMATHGYDRWTHGSVTERVVHGSTVPVMLVRAQGTSLLAQRFAAPAPVLIVPLDGTPLGESALPFAQDLAETVGGQLRLIEVLQHRGLTGVDDTDTFPRDSPQADELEGGVAGYLEAIGNLVEGEALSVETELCFGNIAQEVCAVTNESAAAAVVMATHGRTGLVRTILGSVTAAWSATVALRLY